MEGFISSVFEGEVSAGSFAAKSPFQSRLHLLGRLRENFVLIDRLEQNIKLRIRRRR
jgi:hypothetical protein